MESDFVNRFAGITVSDPDKQWENDFRRQRETAEWGYRQNALARADASGRRTEEEAKQQESVFAGVRKDLTAGASTPGSMAYQYPALMAEIKTLAKGGFLDEANDKIQVLKASADRDNATYRTYAATRPTDHFETAVNAGGAKISQYEFWSEPLTLDDGTVATAGQLFSDGKAYKNFQYDRLVRNNFSDSFASAYRDSGDSFKKRMLSLVADPVMRLPRGQMNPHQSQYQDVGDYLAREWDGMVSELGERGVQRLVQDVVQNRIQSNTAIDTLQNVRDWVFMQRQGANGASLDGYELVRKSLGQFDRMAAASSKGEPTDKERRLYSKVISAVIEGQKSGGPNVDFDSAEVRDRMDRLTSTFRTAEDLRIPLLVEGNEAGTDMRSEMSDYVTGASESNFIRRVDNMFNVTNGMLTSGWTARNGSKPPTSGNFAIDSMVNGMWSELAKSCVPAMGSGMREDLAISRSLNNAEASDDLRRKWAEQISTTGGLSDRTADFLAGKMMEGMRSDNGGIRPVDPRSVIVQASADPGVDRDVKSELMKWYKGTEMAADLLEPFRNEYFTLLSDKTIGPGMNDGQMKGQWAWILKNAATYLENGEDPRNALQILMNRFPVYNPTGSWIIPGLDRTVSEKEYQKMVSAMSNGREYSLGDVQITREMARAARPEVEFSGMPVDLRTTSIKKLNGVSGGFEPGAWLDPANRNAFLSYQRLLKSAYESNVAAASKQADKSAANALKANEEL